MTDKILTSFNKWLNGSRTWEHFVSEGFEAGYKTAISEEREACARICEQIDNIPFASILECAKAIRVRG